MFDGTVRRAGAGGDTKAAAGSVAAASPTDDDEGEEAGVVEVRVARMGVEVDADADADEEEDEEAREEPGGSWRDGRRGERAGDPPGNADGVEVALGTDARIPSATADATDAAADEADDNQEGE